MRPTRRLPARFPDGAKYVLESEGGMVRRYVEFPDVAAHHAAFAFEHIFRSVRKTGRKPTCWTHFITLRSPYAASLRTPTSLPSSDTAQVEIGRAHV